MAQAAAEAASAADLKAATDAGVDWNKIHSAVRWNKDFGDIVTSPIHANCVDSKNGNYPIHIAAQNGHLEAVKKLLAAGAKVNAQNGTGQTPLHMAVGYDIDEVAAVLRAGGADDEIRNWAGHPARLGIEGDKDPNDPLNMMERAKTTAEVLTALDALAAKHAANPGSIDKGPVAIMGMQMKKGNKSLPKEQWTPDCQAKFTTVMQAL
eukprot:CAMPEP_0114555890 /NCGR_PEP_ID=MMETSP0114-20121206/8990_1 /TAXON_ID=31324 /ORGANISM="Goniomonas sp, Strain m" /LENGTH=207 /DNA_ID=CAMNT_0001741045 /DNA_START=42 /DNA_END=665 /DNA_ORIENTATION=+